MDDALGVIGWNHHDLKRSSRAIGSQYEQAQFSVVLLLDVSERRADRVQDVGVFDAVLPGAVRYLQSVIIMLTVVNW